MWKEIPYCDGLQGRGLSVRTTGNLRIWEEIYLYVYIAMIFVDVSVLWRASHTLPMSSLPARNSSESMPCGRGEISLLTHMGRRYTVLSEQEHSDESLTASWLPGHFHIIYLPILWAARDFRLEREVKLIDGYVEISPGERLCVNSGRIFFIQLYNETMTTSFYSGNIL